MPDRHDGGTRRRREVLEALAKNPRARRMRADERPPRGQVEITFISKWIAGRPPPRRQADSDAYRPDDGPGRSRPKAVGARTPEADLLARRLRPAGPG